MTAATRRVDDVIRELGRAEGYVPVKWLEWALDHWEEARPRFLALLETGADGGEMSDVERDALLPIIHLLAEQRESKAFAPLLRLGRRHEDSLLVLGDAITETLPGVLISTYDDDRPALEALIEDVAANPYVRAAALDALAYLTREGRVPEEHTRAYLRRLRAELLPREESFVWNGWATAIAALGYEELRGDVMAAFEDSFIDIAWLDEEEFDELLQLTLADPSGWAGLEAECVAPFTDTIGAVSEWHRFSPEYIADQARSGHKPLWEPGEDGDLGWEDVIEEQLQWEDADDDAWEDAGQEPPIASMPRSNPYRNVGRNDPCPCGSGKKYKKCCLR